MLFFQLVSHTCHGTPRFIGTLFAGDVVPPDAATDFQETLPQDVRSMPEPPEPPEPPAHESPHVHADVKRDAYQKRKMKSQESMKIPSPARPQAQAFLPQVQQSLPNRHRTQMGFPRTRRSKRQLFWQSLSLLKRLGNGKGYGYMMVYVYAVFLSF